MASIPSEIEMTSSELSLIINSLERPDDETAPLTHMLQNSLAVGPGRGRATYRDQRHHWLRWLNEHQRPERRARRIYNSINCPTMIFWLAEAIGMDRERLVSAIHAAEAAPKNQVSQSAAIRRVISWDMIFQLFEVIDVSG